jgi:hypothetical protein
MTLVVGTHALFAQSMQSGTYRIDFDSVNVGGGQSQSGTYLLEDTAGEVGTGYASSTTYNLHAGYQQMHEVYMTISSASDVVMSPSIGGITGGTSNGSTAVTVTTDSGTGYQLLIKASSSPALVSGSNSFADYTPISSDPDYNFNIDPTASEFGFSPEGTDVTSRYLDDNGSFCNSGGSSNSNTCWDPLSTTNATISQNAGPNTPLGTQTVIKFRAASGASHMQPAGTYIATTTLTALPN